MFFASENVMGRPRLYPQGTLASQRVAASTRRLVDGGGARKTFRLKAGAYKALQALVDLDGATETAVIERLLVAEHERRAPARIQLTSASSVWSSPGKRDHVSRLPARLANASFLDLIELCRLHGPGIVSTTLEDIRSEIPAIQYRIEREMLDNIKMGLGHAS